MLSMYTENIERERKLGIALILLATKDSLSYCEVPRYKVGKIMSTMK